MPTLKRKRIHPSSNHDVRWVVGGVVIVRMRRNNVMMHSHYDETDGMRYTHIHTAHVSTVLYVTILGQVLVCVS